MDEGSGCVPDDGSRRAPRGHGPGLRRQPISGYAHRVMTDPRVRPTGFSVQGSASRTDNVSMRKSLRTASGRRPEPEPVKRLSLNLPESLHLRFKTACSATNRKMMTEIQGLVARRTEELEDEAGLSASGWARQVSRRAQRRLQALDQALECNHPTGDTDQMLADIERGRDLR